MTNRPLIAKLAPKKRHPANQLFTPFPFDVTAENQYEHLKNIMSPLWNMSYEEQLQVKNEKCKNSLRALARDLYNADTPIRLNVNRLPCHCRPTVPSPIRENYRTKDSFSVWKGYDGQTPTVGHLLFPRKVHGDSICVDPIGSLTLDDRLKKTVELVQEYVREHRKLPICYNVREEGGWLSVDTSITNREEIMVAARICPIDIEPKDLFEEGQHFKRFIQEQTSNSQLNIASLQLVIAASTSNIYPKDSRVDVLLGPASLMDKSDRFNISFGPLSYRMANPAIETACYTTIRKVIEETFEFDRKPLMVIFNAHSGLLAMHLSDLASHVIAVNNCDQVVDEIVSNLKMNDINNVEVTSLEFGDVIMNMIQRHLKRDTEIVVVLDVDRTQLSKRNKAVLRKIRQVKKIVYIATPGQLSILDLCEASKAPNTLKPFVPVMAVSVDTMPQTTNYRTIIALERLTDA